MESTAPALGQAPSLEALSAKQGEASSRLPPGRKRPASETEFHGDEDATGRRNEHIGDAPDLPSPKRMKGPGSPGDGGASDSASVGEQTDLPAPQVPPKAHSGWNSGINSGLRTSFAAKGKLRKPTSKRASESRGKPPAESIDIDSLAMPSGDVDLSGSAGDNIWQTRFMKWCARLMALNKDREGLKDAALLREAWGLWLETHVVLSRSRRAAGVEAAKKTDLGPEKLDGMFSEARETDPQGPWIESPEEAEKPEGSESGQQSNGQPKSNKSTPHGTQQEPKETHDWTLPPPPSASDFEVSQKDERGWQERFVSWCKSLIQLNEKKIKVTTTRERNRVAESYLRWVGTVEGLSKAKAASARRAAVHYAQDNSARLAAIFAYTPIGAPPQTTKSALLPQDDATASPTVAVSDGPDGGSAGVLDGEDAEYREKYFPGVELSERFCHLCASRGHNAVDCPEMTCRFCRDSGHRSFSCPTRLRCTKCRQLGHAKNDCTEKLALPQEEMECAFCQSRDHADASCHELWRSFLFNPATVRKVRSLPVFCYCCGREGHYGPVCGLNPQKLKEGPWETWSQANRDRYLDPASPEMAIIFTGSVGSSASGRPDLGKSIVPKRHIFFEEADDDDDAEEFIRPPVQKSARVGNISFAGNNAGGARGGRRASKQNNDRNGRIGYAQPPLPPGPPPPLPPQGYQESRNGGRRRGGGGRY